MTVVEDDTPGPSARSAAPSDGGAGTGTFADLLVTELRRVWVRRITRFLLLAVAAVIVVIWIGYAWNSRPLATSELQRMQSFYQTDLDSWQKECNDDGTLKDGVDPQTAAWGDCSFKPERDNYVWARSSHFADLPVASLGLIGIASAAMLVLAASLVGADINSGNLGTQLLFVPQRGRVFAARAIATAVAAAGLAVATLAVGSLGMWLLVRHFATTDADTHGNARLWWATSSRGILVVIAVALTAYAVTWVLGHTAATIGVAGAWMIIVEQFVSGADQLGGLRPFAPAMNLMAIAQGRGTYTQSLCTNVQGGRSCDYVEKTYSLAHALTLWGVLLVVLLGFAMWWFHRKDVT